MVNFNDVIEREYRMHTRAPENTKAMGKIQHPPCLHQISGHLNLNILSLCPVVLDNKIDNEKIKAEIALNSISDAVICTDLNGIINYLNTAAEKITGWTRKDAYGLPSSQVFNIINGTTKIPITSPVALVLQSNQPVGLAMDTSLIKRDGSEIAIEDSTSPIHDWHGQLTGVVIVFHDVSNARAMAMKMAHLAQHDFLTNLPNRVLLNDRIAQAIESSKRHHTKIALLFLDLDNFKHINDSLGHSTGDKLLQLVTSSLHACIRSNDTISRQGGDEFIILLSDIKNGEDAALTADKILALLTLPNVIANNQIYITTSIGISVYPEDGHKAEALIQNADTAMYHAKAQGRNNYQFFKNEMNARAVERQTIEMNLRSALLNHEFILLYQPKFNLVTQKMIGVEALIRWQHSEWGEVSPERFITIAEDSGLIIPIGKWVLREACQQVRRWLNLGLKDISIAVNISAQEFRYPNFISDLQQLLKEADIDAHYLELEITESVLMHDAKSSVAILHQLKEMGFILVVDDFGTGYSSLSYLQKFPIDVLKIDRSFVTEIESTHDDGVIVSAIISMGNSLRLRVIAEGIENQQHVDFLTKHFCTEGQGFFFSPPLTVPQFENIYCSKADKPMLNSI
jgi:diguanylate cyclase (GGDEF)-like protein/PAS domain S-box-containing protein